MPDEIIQPIQEFHDVIPTMYAVFMSIIIGPHILYRFTVAQLMISYVPNCINPFPLSTYLL